MYALVGGSLALLIVAAALLSTFGQLAFTPFELLTSAVVFCGIGAATSLALGKAYGIYVHFPSAMITGMILTLLFTPSLDKTVLLQFALISIIAQASKFVVAYKGRHIFNPAAFGATAGGLLGLQFASWWVGTPVLLPILLATAFVLLYKTRLLQMGLLFLAISLTIVTLNGTEPWIAIASWPILFLAGFMLTEPATLPPRNWQRYVVAITVAIAVSIPYEYGWFQSSPAIALLIGNIVAFGLGYSHRADLGLRFASSKPLTPTTQELTFTSSRPVIFEPGQYIELTLPYKNMDARGVRRHFSLTSKPGDTELRLGVKFYEPSSAFKKQLQQLPADTSVMSTGIVGDFVLPRQKNEKLLFVAGGIGITPFISMIRSGIDDRDVILLYFVREPDEAAYRDVIDSSGVKVYYFASDPENTAPFHTAQRLDDELLKTYVADLPQRHAYASGPPVMVAGAKTYLRGAKAIKTDYFSGY